MDIPEPKPWCLDKTDPKIFKLSSFYLHDNESPENLEDLIRKVKNMIKSLGGIVLEDETTQDTSYTHLIYRADNQRAARNGGLSEELMVCMASGKFGLTVRYLEKSLSSGCFRQDLSAFMSDEVKRNVERRYFAPRGGEGLFFQMKTILLMKEKDKCRAYERIIISGGGEAKKATISSDILSQLEPAPSHVFCDSEDLFSPWLILVKERHPEIFVLDYVYLFACIKAGKRLPETDFQKSDYCEIVETIGPECQIIED